MGRPALHSKIMSTERNFLPNGARREEITPSLNHHRGSPRRWTAVESALLFRHRAVAVGQRTERLRRRNRLHQLVEISRRLGLGGSLHLEQIHVVDVAAILADMTLAEQRILRGYFLHPGGDLLSIVRIRTSIARRKGNTSWQQQTSAAQTLRVRTASSAATLRHRNINSPQQCRRPLLPAPPFQTLHSSIIRSLLDSNLSRQQSVGAKKKHRTRIRMQQGETS